ncbi:MAG: cytochrome c3 family protein [Myxococcales bacterium]|jgi:hypothetical protein
MMTKHVAVWLSVLLLAIGSQVSAEAEPVQDARPLPGGQCLTCHLTVDDKLGELWATDIHAQAGIGCVDCHGGDPNAEVSEKAKRAGTGYRGIPSPLEITRLCGGCHADVEYMKARDPLLPTDQLEKYKTSVHGKLLVKGETRVAQCASCHHAHGIREVDDAKSPVYAENVPGTCGHCHADADYMADFHIPTNQYDDYMHSVHGKALIEKHDVRGAPACNDCHGNHGAAPPSIDAISNICGTCHTYNAKLFLESPLAPDFKEKALADCVACHGKHRITHVSDDWLNDEPGGTCRKCHKTGDEGAELALYYADTLGSIRESFDEIDELLDRAENKGMDVTEAKDAEEAARQGLLQARTLIHAFSKPIMEDKVTEIAANQAAALEMGYQALNAFDARRRGLAVSTLLLLLLTVVVAIKIRTLPPTD